MVFESERSGCEEKATAATNADLLALVGQLHALGHPVLFLAGGSPEKRKEFVMIVDPDKVKIRITDSTLTVADMDAASAGDIELR